ncbi:protein-(glutamine-N5) methyltransferase [[Clostridium] cellulosi]|uniref:Release factor glutamine methyltransferase n=1 Tax=[Clostridium] cellulosi TaxID=29343 RepID=A0A078KIP1_9FIRM|nr:protein-(glutamine-N5) methyltransferase [[Clostridium] cellulosi]
MYTIHEAFLKAKKRLADAGIADAGFDAAKIIEKHTGYKRHEILLYGEKPLCCPDDEFWSDVERRAKHEPLQYIFGKWPFFGLDFFVGKGVLIPRPDTEVLCEVAISYLSEKPSPKILDLCAGSGCISTAILKNVENSTAVCVELSDDALYYLKKNIDFHGLKERAEIVKGDVLANETLDSLAFDFDAIVCNPPYINSGDIPALEPEVAEYEPITALDGGEDGLLFYRSAGRFLPHLKSGGFAAFEVGAGQSDDVSRILENSGYRDIFIKKDYAGIERVVGGFSK